MSSSYHFGNNIYEYNEKFGIKKTKYQVMAPPQHQNDVVGIESIMTPLPICDDINYKASDKLKGKVAIITGGDSGFGKACAISFSKEGASLVIPYLKETDDALETKRIIESYGGKCLLIETDIKNPENAYFIVENALNEFGHIDILVNNAGVQYQADSLEDISNEQFDYTMKTNVYGMFYLTKAVLPHLKSGSSIINMSSVTAFSGEPQLIDYVTTKAAIIGFTRSLASSLALKNIRVNAIAPGFFWTPLQPACFEKEKIPTLGSDNKMGRGAMPYELSSTFVYLASDDSSYLTGQVLHVNGGELFG